MDVEESLLTPPPTALHVSEPKEATKRITTPFLIRTFVKVGTFHRLSLFEESTLPAQVLQEECQISTWPDTTLPELLTTLRLSSVGTSPTAPQTPTSPISGPGLNLIASLSPEYRHPLARYSFRAIYADPANRGRMAQKDLGIVYSRDILGEPGTLTTTAPRLLDGDEGDSGMEVEGGGGKKGEIYKKTLGELKFQPGDYLCVAILLPKSAGAAPGEIAIKGSAVPNGPPTKPATKPLGGDGGWSGGLGVGSGGAPGGGRGAGGHWRGGSDAPVIVPAAFGARGGGRGRGAAAFGGGDRERERVPPPRRDRDSPPHRTGGAAPGAWGDRGRGAGRGGRGGRGAAPTRGGGRRGGSRTRSVSSRSRSRTPEKVRDYSRSRSRTRSRSRGRDRSRSRSRTRSRSPLPRKRGGRR